MKKIALLALLLPALASAGTFVSDGSTFPNSPKSDAVTCKVPYSQQWCAADITARDNAIYDLRAAVLALQGGTMTQVAWASITGVPTSFPSAWAQISNKPTTFASDWTLVANKPASYQPPLATASSIGGVYADPPCATGYVFKGHGLDGHAICKALGEEIYLALRTTDGNPPADPNQLVWFDGSSGATPTVGPPMFTPIAGTYAGGQNVALSSSTTGAVFCYTVGGSTPAASTPGSCSAGNLYTGPIAVSSNLTLKAIATKVGYTNSGITSGDYVINNSVAAPTFAPPAGSYVGAQSVTMTSATTGATLCLTTNGSDPAATTPGSCSAGAAYANGLTASVSQTMNLKVLATKAGMANSSIVTAAYTIASHPADLFSPAAGPVTSGTTIIVGSNTPACNAYIYWNTTGSPTASDNHGTVTSAITTPTTIYTKVIGCPNMADSTVASASYTITGVAQAAAPTFSPTPGTVASGTNVYATTTTPGGVVHCTWDGSAPTSGSSTAVVPHIVNTTETLRCITIASGYLDSAEASATYTVQQAATPTFSPAAGAVAYGTTITPSSTTPSATLRCTTDGSDPTSGSTATPTVTVSPPVTVKCRATATGYLASSIASASYTQAQAATPTITPNGGSISGTTSVTLACSSPSPTIRYTTDGSTPNGSSTTYSGAFNVSATTTVKAICQSSGYADSAVASATFTLVGSLGLPNGDFESALGATTDGSFGSVGDAMNVYPGDVGHGTVTRTSSSPLVGSYSLDLTANMLGTGSSYVGAVTRATKAQIDASNGHLKFKIRPTTTVGTLYISTEVFNGAGALIQDSTNQKHTIVLYGANTGSANNVTYKFTPTAGVTQDIDINLASHLNAISTWANAAEVHFWILATCPSTTGGVPAHAVLDNFVAQ